VKLKDIRLFLRAPGIMCKTIGYTPSEATNFSLLIGSSVVSSKMAYAQRKYYSEANFVLENNI
jgi:hypothetical protein